MRNKLFLLMISSIFFGSIFGFALEKKQTSSAVQTVDRAFPEFTQNDLLKEDQMLSRSDFTAHEYQLVNIWASWCGICKSEHEFLNQLKNQGIPIYGVNYRDNKLAALKVLKDDGNPYLKIAFDHNGDLSINLGVIGTPETYLVDQSGRIIKKVYGVIDHTIWNKELASYFND